MNRIATSLALAVGSITLVGCSTGNDINDVSYGSITRNLTPELRSIAERPIDIDRHVAATNNGNMRALWVDIGHIFYTDYPSRLSAFPIFSNSGMPR